MFFLGLILEQMVGNIKNAPNKLILEFPNATLSLCYFLIVTNLYYLLNRCGFLWLSSSSPRPRPSLVGSPIKLFYAPASQFVYFLLAISISLKAMWPDFAKFSHIDRRLTISWKRFDRFNLCLALFWTYFGKCYDFGQIFLIVNV